LTPQLKDDHLASIAMNHNVARFISFGVGAEPPLRHAVIDTHGTCSDLETGVRALLSIAPSVNLRVFSTTPIKSAPFHYGLSSLTDTVALVRRYAANGLYTIVNETIDVDDGGVSGVSLGGIVEFAPKDTPRAVEKPGVTRLSRELGATILRLVYGFQPDLPSDRDLRVEFSLHPVPAGFRQRHTILWELEHIDEITLPWRLEWPNRFSRLLGDKAFGLLVGHALGVPVPETIVIGRSVAPFRFGTETGSPQVWLRTCPTEQVAGKFTTSSIWQDPYALLHREDPTGTMLAGVLAQRAVLARYSGASLPVVDGADEIQGVAGSGDRFMRGEQEPVSLPNRVVADVRALIARLRTSLGPVRIEWTHDGKKAWLLQLHVVEQASSGNIIYPGEADHWLAFDPNDGLDVLRRVAAEAVDSGFGVRVVRPIGTTSHIGDILRKAKVPARIMASSK